MTKPPPRLARTALMATALAVLCAVEGQAAPAASVTAPAESVTDKLHNTTLKASRTETEERDGILVAERSYDASGALLEESRYGPEGLVETRTYLRDSGRLTKVEAKDSKGALVGSLDYRYDGRGRLVAVIPSGSLGAGTVGMISSGPSPSGSWAADGSRLTVQRLDEKGRPLRIETLAGGKAIARRKYAYGEGVLPIRVEDEDLAAQTSLVSEYDGAGRILIKSEYLKAALRSRSEYRYDAAGRLTEERSRNKGSLVLRTLSYDEEGTLAREETRTDGVLTGAVEYRGELRIVERYHEGLLFAKTTYRSARKVKDEFYVEGVLSRSKEYP